MASWQEEIRPRQSVWDDHKNGVIDGIDYDNRLVHVNYYEKGRRTYEFDELLGNWDDKLQQWVIVSLI